MRQPRYPVVWFLVWTYLLTFVGQGIHHFVVQRLSAGTPPGTSLGESPVTAWFPYGFYVTNVGPSLVGLLMTLALYGWAGAGRLIARLAPWSVGRSWPVLAAGLFLPLAGVLVSLMLAGEAQPKRWELSSYVYAAVVSGGLLGPGICEELGWRGFALPHLQRRYSALTSSLVVGVAWALWHWPNYFIMSQPHPYWAFAALIPMGMAASIIYTWVYNSTGGNLFAVVVLHGATVSAPKPSEAPGGAAAVIGPLFYVVIAVVLVWKYGAANLSRRERVMSGPPGGGIDAVGEAGEE